MLLEKIKNNIFNLRLYSLVDLILLGYLAKFSVEKFLIFTPQDLFFISGLVFLWFFFNTALEIKHNYSYRGKVSLLLPIVFAFLSVMVSISQNLISLIPLLISIFLVLVYLQKNKNKFLGNFSILIRGLIQSSYFFFVLFLFQSNISRNQILLGIIIILIYTARALIADIRDVKHNKEANKQTIPVVFGNTISRILIVIILVSVVLIQILFFKSYLITLAIILFAISIIFFSNGYVLHQLMILTASFSHINFIAFFTNQNLIFLNIIYLGIFLNFIFYPLLQRKSNPMFVN